MDEDQVTLGLIKVAIYDLPSSDQQKVKACAEKIRSAVNESGVYGTLALALVGAEAAVAAGPG